MRWTFNMDMDGISIVIAIAIVCVTVGGVTQCNNEAKQKLVCIEKLGSPDCKAVPVTTDQLREVLGPEESFKKVEGSKK